MLDVLARLVVAATSLYLVGLGVLALARPDRVEVFLLRLAQTPTAHYAELAARAVVGAAFWAVADASHFPEAFRLFGGVLLVTTAVLALLPWRVHRRFARRTVPRALRFVGWIGAASLGLGAAMIYGVWP